MTWGQAIRGAAFFWAVLIIVLVLAAVSRAEWVDIQQFQGLSTATNGISRDMSVARWVDGWQVRSEGLVKPWFTRYATNPVVADPTYILGHSATGDAVLAFAGNFYRLKNDTLDNVKVRPSNQPDSARAINGTDSILTLSDHAHTPCVDTVKWLDFALTDRSLVVWNTEDISVDNFYSNRWLKSKAALTVQVALLNYPVSTPSVDEGSGTLDWPDSTAIFDGDYVFLYEAQYDSIRNVNNTTILSPPVYQAAGSNAAHVYDTVRVLNTYELGAGDTVLQIAVNTDDSLRGGDYTRFWVLMDDTLSTSQCVPCSVAVADTTSPDSVLMTLLCDSTRYAGVNHYWGRVEGSGSACMYAILYRPGTKQDVTPWAGVFCDRVNSGSASLAPRAYFNYVGRFGRLHYATLEVGSNNTYEAFTAGLRAKKARITDCDIFEVISTGADPNGNYYLAQDTAQMVCQYYKGDTLGWTHYWKFLLFDTDTLKKSQFDSLAVNGTSARSDRLVFYNRPRVGGWSVTTTSATASKYRFAVLGNLRAWAGGYDDNDSAKHVAYTDAQSHNITGATFDYYEFDDPDRVFFSGADRTTGLSSLGGAIIRWTRRKAWQLTGEPPSTYVQEVGIGQGAVNHWTIARSPLDNADCIVNENGQFLFSGGGLELLTSGLRDIFKDSINWDAEAKMRGCVWDNVYFVAAPWDTFTTNQKVIATDLETRQSWLMSKPPLASLWNFRDDDGSEEWYGGSADSSVMYKLNGDASNYYFVPEWKSCWSDLGDPESIKRIQRYRVEITPTGYLSDTVLVDWYLDLSDIIYAVDSIVSAAVWTDTIDVGWELAQFQALWPNPGDYPTGVAGYTNAANLLESRAKQPQTIYRNVPREVQGKFFSVGIRATGRAAAPFVVSSFGFEYNTVGRRR